VVVVLPFEHGGDQGLSAVAVGLADTLTRDLAGLSGLVVVPRSDALRYAGTGAAARASREQGASYIVQGELGREAEGLALEISLAAADGRGVVWHRRYVGQALELGRRAREDLVMALRGPLGRPPSLGTGGTSDPLAWEHYSQARQMLDRADVPENVTRAIPLLISATTRDPNYALAFLALGEAYWAQYTLTKEETLPVLARDALIKAQALRPNHPDSHYQLAVLYHNTGRLEDAIRELADAIAENPDNHAAHTLLGQILFSRGRQADGIGEFRKAIEIRPQFVRGYSSLGVAAYRMGRFDEMEAAYRRVTELQPDSPAGHEGLGSAYFAMGRFREAEEAYLAAVKLGAGTNARLNLATVYYETGRYPLAIEGYRDLVGQVPGNTNYWRHLGDAYRDHGERELAREAYSKAVEAAEQALKVNPRDGRTRSLLAVSLAHLGDYAQARDQARRAIDLSPGDFDVLYRAAVVSALAREEREVIPYLSRAVGAGYPRVLLSRDKTFVPFTASPEFRKLVSPEGRP
jgi:serine/threonine-protein kinase